MGALAAALAAGFLVVHLLACRAARNAARYWGRYQSVRFRPQALSRTHIKAGDILLFNATTHGFINSFLYYDVFSHCAVVVEDEKVGGVEKDTGEGTGKGTGEATGEGMGGGFRPLPLLVSESTQGAELMEDPETGVEIRLRPGAGLSPLLVRIKNYPGQVFHMPIDEPLTDGQKKSLRALAGENSPYPTFWEAARGIVLGHNSSKSRHCFEHASWLLGSVGVPAVAALRGAGYLGVCKALPRLSGKGFGEIVALQYDF